MTDFKIAWLLPDTLNLHGERGNILALSRFAALAGFKPVVEKIDFEKVNFDPQEYDFLFCAPGSLTSVKVVLAWLDLYRTRIKKYVADGRPMLVTGTSTVLFGERLMLKTGEMVNGIGVTQTQAWEREVPYGDDLYFKTVYNGKQMEIIGSQIQLVRTDIRKEKPFGTLEYGFGNNGEDRNEGSLVNNAVFTNSLGPILVCNPWLTVEMIRVAADFKQLEMKEITYDMDLERKSFETKKEFIMNKKTTLTNCDRK